LSGKSRKVWQNRDCAGIFAEKVIFQDAKKRAVPGNCRDFNKTYLGNGLKTGFSEGPSAF